jgi:hypothetical protein
MTISTQIKYEFQKRGLSLVPVPPEERREPPKFGDIIFVLDEKDKHDTVTAHMTQLFPQRQPITEGLSIFLAREWSAIRWLYLDRRERKLLSAGALCRGGERWVRSQLGMKNEPSDDFFFERQDWTEIRHLYTDNT